MKNEFQGINGVEVWAAKTGNLPAVYESAHKLATMMGCGITVRWPDYCGGGAELICDAYPVAHWVDQRWRWLVQQGKIPILPTK